MATDLFGAHGYERTRMTQVAERVGVTKPVLYRHFASKEALFLACALRTWQAMGRAIFEAATRPGPPDVRLWRGISAYFDFIDEHRAVWRVVYPQASRGDTEVGRELREAQRASVQMMAGLFASTADEEHVDPALATLAEPLAWAFVGAATALAARWLENPDEPKELQSLRLMNFAWQGLDRKSVV